MRDDEFMQPGPVGKDAADRLIAYVEQAIKEETANAEGGNQALNDATFALATLGAALHGLAPGLLSQERIRARMNRVVDGWTEFRGGSEQKQRDTIESGLKAGWAKPRDLATIIATVTQDADPVQPTSIAVQPPPIATPCSLEQCHKVFRKWLGEEYDMDSLNAVLAAAAVERLDGDPLWLLVLSGPGHTKTETVAPLQGAGALVVSAIVSEGALLSATGKRDRAKDATGGLLRQLGSQGTLVIKDMTTILSMNRDARAQVLAALREIYDGHWVRDVGTDGGRRLTWQGRICVVGAVTSAWDRAHAVISTMGDRFVIVRTDSAEHRRAIGRRAIGNTGSEVEMRAALSDAAGGVLAGINEDSGITVTEDESERLLAAADVVTLARTSVECDYQGRVIDADMPEAPTRFAKQLTQVLRGAVAIGMNRSDALRLAIRCAKDSVPPLRLAILLDMAEHPHSSTTDVRKRLKKPHNTVDRQIQALQMLGLVWTEESGESVAGKTVWRYGVTESYDPNAFS
ncbi:hypothetical protein ABT116_06785 [Streptomyces sp. NPDC002130]|uniref:hypothetical protein n=1 Tax=Streptomyces sp. NPDC002130 TaxID=3155568 RepID=UPI00331C1D2F